MNFFEKRKIRKQLKSLLHHARTVRSSREDLMNVGELAFIDEHMRLTREAHKAGDVAAMEAAGTALEACVAKLNPPKPLAGWRENFDVLVVAISVAMAFRFTVSTPSRATRPRRGSSISSPSNSPSGW